MNKGNNQTVISQAGDTLSIICWRAYGRSSGVVELVLAANPHLAPYTDGTSPMLPAGITITLPPVSQPVNQPGTIQLWT